MALKNGRQGGAGSAKDCPERGLSPYFQSLSVRSFCCDFLQIWTRFHAHCVDSGPLFTKEMRQVVVVCNEMKRIGGEFR